MPSGAPGQADLREAGPDRRLAGDERGPACRAALLAVPVGEQRALVGDAVDIRRLVAHHPAVVRADVELADVVAPDDKDIGLGGCLGVRGHGGDADGETGAPGQHRSSHYAGSLDGGS